MDGPHKMCLLFPLPRDITTTLFFSTWEAMIMEEEHKVHLLKVIAMIVVIVSVARSFMVSADIVTGPLRANW